MSKNRINTTSVREIKSSFKRFLSLLVMSMLGVGVFVGIKMSAPDMIKSLDKYYDNNNVYDIKLVSTLGLTNNDLDYIRKIDGVLNAYGSYSKDVLIKENNEEVVIKVISTTKGVNDIEIIKGKMPENNNEIVVEEAMVNKNALKIGDKIKLFDDDTFKENELTVVGIVKSPLYITNIGGSSNRGNTNIGTGKISYFAYVNESNFNLDYYTEIYLNIKESKEKTTNSKEYKKIVNNVKNKIENIKEERASLRYNEIYNKINDEIIKNELEGNKRLKEAKLALDDAENKLKEGKEKLDSNKEVLDKSLIELNLNNEKLNSAKLLLDSNKEKLDEAKKEIDNAKEIINGELSAYKTSLEDIEKFKERIYEAEIPKESITNIIPDDIIYHDEIINTIDRIYELELGDKFKEFLKSPDKKEELIKLVPEDSIYYDQIVDAINFLADEETIKNIEDYISDPDNIDNIINKIPEGTPYYDEIIRVAEFYKQNSSKVIELKRGIKKLKEAEEKYNDGILKYNNGLEEYNSGYNLYTKYYNDYQNGLSLYNNGLLEYNNNLNLYNTKVKEYYDSRKMFDLKIIEAKKELDKIPEAKWLIYDRLDDSGYSGFIDDSNSVSNLSKIFPVIFFIVAVLISLISMSRMVEDDRLLIGTLKSLGFNNKMIRKKYILYSGMATILGGVIGSLLGFFLLPRFIWNIYQILFNIPVFKYDYNPTNIILGISISVICICGTTLLTIRKVVKEKPSDLMRPKAPSNCKRVILEKIPFIWNKISFSNKITIRNLFRYKKRVFMTIGGILGCTALMLAGFGIRDSVVGIPDKQFKEVFNFDQMVYLTGDITEEKLNNIFSDKHIINRLDTKMDASLMIDKYSINLFVPSKEENMKNVINFRTFDSHKSLKLETNKVVISDKLARLLKKSVNDKITIRDSEGKNYEFVISGICENYVSHYVFMNKETYESNFDDFVVNISYINIDNLKNEENVSKILIKNESVMSVVSVHSTIQFIDDMLKSLNSVVFILIILSGALSFVVLYNLSYINITERKREIATLKVLGFTDKEVDNYITKEIIILTIIGILLGLILGIYLTNVILDTVEIELVRFLRNHINIRSFILTSVIVMIFTLIVNKIIHYALKKIDMIESLKSVE